jgi:hypothetical protein
MASAKALAPTRVYQGGDRKLYGKLRFTHKSAEEVFIAWVTVRSSFLQRVIRVKGTVSLQTLEREFYRTEERLPRNIVDELVSIVDAREKTKMIHAANGTHDRGHENCLQMYTYFLRTAQKQIPTPAPAAPTPPNPISEDDFPPISSQSFVPPTCCPSTKRPYSTIQPVPATPSILRTGRVKKPRLILKTGSTWATRPAGAAW